MTYISKIFVTVDICLIRKGVDIEILLIKRKKQPFQGSWALPGGFVDEGEDLEDAAKRELMEETGVNAPTLLQLKAFGKPGRDPRHHTVAVAFIASTGIDVIATAGDDAAEAQWFRLDALPELAFDHDEIIEFAKTRLSEIEIF